eukprot:1141969-Rhodomonas_salina.1
MVAKLENLCVAMLTAAMSAFGRWKSPSPTPVPALPPIAMSASQPAGDARTSHHTTSVDRYLASTARLPAGGVSSPFPGYEPNQPAPYSKIKIKQAKCQKIEN